MRRESTRLLELVSHDEDSRVSLAEFLAAFIGFSTADVITLVVNLLRAGMICKVPKRVYVYRKPCAHHFYCSAPRGQAAESVPHSPEPSPQPPDAGEGGVHDTPAHSLLSSTPSSPHACVPCTPAARAEASRHFFLLDLLFMAWDRDLDGRLDRKDLQRWLRADPWITQTGNEDIFRAVDACWKELSRRREAEHGGAADN